MEKAEATRFLKLRESQQKKEASKPVAEKVPVEKVPVDKSINYIKNLLIDTHRITQEVKDYKESELEEREGKNLKREGKKALRRKYLEGKAVLTDPTEEREAYRARILSVSLFPNVFNKETIMTSLGPS